MAHRIEVTTTIPDTRAAAMKRALEASGIMGIDGVRVVDVYTLDALLGANELSRMVASLTNPVFQKAAVDKPIAERDSFIYAVEIGFLPGVTDNVGTTVREVGSDLLGKQFKGQGAYASRMLLLSGNITREEAQRAGAVFANPLIQRVLVKTRPDFERDGGMGVSIPRVALHELPKIGLVNILNTPDEELVRIGKQGIANSDGSRRGPLALDFLYMKTIRNYFGMEGRNPTDVELEMLAQTWSEHCKHTIFADPIDDIKDGLFRHFIKRATDEICASRKDGLCVSVFKDNSGAIAFDDSFLITDKVETHNSPSALDPFGGAITGIVGVNRDAIGFGLGARPVANRYGFCFGNPDDLRVLYRGAEMTQPILSPRRIMGGVIAGVNSGGNCSGIPTPQGFAYFDDSYRGKPFVFVGTVGLIPREEGGRELHKKRACAGDLIVMLGGRVGKDGIHGATFSSEAIDSGSPATAVQIGDPITQKKMSDALVGEARALGLYTSLTDNGAGGLSCSVAEMARESGGCHVNLGSVPLKYPGLQPWEVWISESQERMTAAVPREKWAQLHDLMNSRGVEATVIGEFTDSGRCVVEYQNETVVNLDMNFLHNGLPPRPMKTTFTRPIHFEPDFVEPRDLTATFMRMLSRKNIASTAFISEQYDHEVQGGSVIKPLQGKGLVNGDATVFRPVLNSNRGVVLSHGINPSYSDIDTYNMAAAAIDTAVRNTIAVGAPLERIALLDNFCWCSSNDPERRGQLVRAVRACYDVAVAYGTPFISGKDSMFNDFKGFDENGEPIVISAKPTLLASSLAVMDDVRTAVSLDAKFPGDFVYVVGLDRTELGGSEYFAMMGTEREGKPFIGNRVPEVDVAQNKCAYDSLASAIASGLVASAQSVHRGGLGVALAKTAMGGRLGMEVALDNLNLPSTMRRADYDLYSESQGRFVVTVSPANASRFERAMGSVYTNRVGVVREAPDFVVRNNGGHEVVRVDINSMLNIYRATFRGY